MKVVQEDGLNPSGWSPKAVKFAADLGERVKGDKEAAELVVLIAMNVIGGIAFSQDCSPEVVVARVIHTAHWQLQQQQEAERLAKVKERMN